MNASNYKTMSELLKKFFGSELGNAGEVLKSNSTEIVWDEITTNDLVDTSNLNAGNVTNALNQIAADLNL